MNATPTTALVNGIQYLVLAYTSNEDMRVKGSPKAADDMARRGFIGQAVLRRPKGRVVHLALDAGPHVLYGENRRWVLC